MVPGFVFLASAPLTAQDAVTTVFDRSSVGFQIHQYQRDFGVGAHFTTPYIRDAIALRAGVSGQWLDHTPAGETVPSWDPYLQARVGILGRNFVIPDRVSIYSEAGLVYLRPSERFSEARSRYGGYGLLGVEFHLHRTLGQFLEVGGVRTGARAELSEGTPIYSNGFLMSAGMRWYW
jgi:hypothetical protein